jgi:hypothetical protein
MERLRASRVCRKGSYQEGGRKTIEEGRRREGKERREEERRR